jgi:HSP20 family protein
MKFELVTKKDKAMLVKRDYSTPAYPRLFADFFDNEFGNWSRSNFSKTETTLPAVNILETDKQFSVEVAAPGMKKEDFDIQIHDNVLTISSEKSTESEEKEKNYTRREYNYLSFKRSFTLPKDIIDIDKVEAKYEEGELKIVIPKKEEAKPKGPQKVLVG